MSLADQSGRIFHATPHSGCLAFLVASMSPAPVRTQKGTAEVKGEELSLVILQKTPWEEAAKSPGSRSPVISQKTRRAQLTSCSWGCQCLGHRAMAGQ